MSIFCRHNYKCNIKGAFITHNSPDSYYCIQHYIQFMCKKCHKFEDKTYYVCCTNFGKLIVSEDWFDIKPLMESDLIKIFDDRQTMIDTIKDDLKYQSFIKKLEKKYGITIN